MTVNRTNNFCKTTWKIEPVPLVVYFLENLENRLIFAIKFAWFKRDLVMDEVNIII